LQMIFDYQPSTHLSQVQNDKLNQIKVLQQNLWVQGQ